jgi:hypothetical protein
MTLEQACFVSEVMAVYDVRDWPHNLVGDLVTACTRCDDIEVARITAMMVIELAAAGEPVSTLSMGWLELFGELLEAPV